MCVMSSESVGSLSKLVASNLSFIHDLRKAACAAEQQRHRPRFFPVLPSPTQPKSGAGEGQRGSDLSLTIGQFSLTVGSAEARIEESAPVKVGGLMCCPTPTPGS